ncbi:MAG TPA: sugar porter family MFS transporter [Candidatus Hydrogenedentes bacterium]|nr:sugar porter family MFS transporter [Candidatus Hydrogenedentota bacterium]
MKEGKMIRFAFTAALGGLLFGFDTAVISGTTEMIQSVFRMTDAQLGWAVSSALVGCVVGAVGIGRPGDRYGRRNMLVVTAVLLFASAVWTGAARSYTEFWMARVLGGFGVGGASVMAPMYIAEIAPPRRRGLLVSTAQLAIVLGIVSAFFSNYLLASIGEASWRFMFWAEGIPAVVYFAMLFFVDESPRWLVRVGRKEEALAVIRETNPEEDPEQVLHEITLSLADEEASKHVRLFHAPYLRLVLIGMVVGVLNQCTGINAIMYYAPMIFKAAGFGQDSALLQTVVIGTTNLVFTFVGMAVIDKVGRKKLLMLGGIAMPVFLGLFAYGYIREIPGYFLVACTLAYVMFFCTTQGIVIWVILSEMFPNRIRARASALASFALWVACALNAFLFPVLKAKIDIGPIFIFYALVTFASFFFFWKYLVETKGRTLEEIEALVLDARGK